MVIGEMAAGELFRREHVGGAIAQDAGRDAER